MHEFKSLLAAMVFAVLAIATVLMASLIISKVIVL
jgi:hypothetical protein